MFKIELSSEKKAHTVCIILHPLIDVVGHSYILTEIHMINFCIKVLFHHLQELIIDMKSILHKEGIGNFHHVLSFFGRDHVRKIFQERKFFTCKIANDKFFSETDVVKDHYNTVKNMRTTVTSEKRQACSHRARIFKGYF